MLIKIILNLIQFTGNALDSGKSAERTKIQSNRSTNCVHCFRTHMLSLRVTTTSNATVTRLQRKETNVIFTYFKFFIILKV